MDLLPAIGSAIQILQGIDCDKHLQLINVSTVSPTLLQFITEVWHMAHFWVSYGRCTMPGSPMGRSEGLSRRWAG